MDPFIFDTLLNAANSTLLLSFLYTQRFSLFYIPFLIAQSLYIYFFFPTQNFPFFLIPLLFLILLIFGDFRVKAYASKPYESETNLLRPKPPVNILKTIFWSYFSSRLMINRKAESIIIYISALAMVIFAFLYGLYKEEAEIGLIIILLISVFLLFANLGALIASLLINFFSRLLSPVFALSSTTETRRLIQTYTTRKRILSIAHIIHIYRSYYNLRFENDEHIYAVDKKTFKALSQNINQIYEYKLCRGLFDTLFVPRFTLTNTPNNSTNANYFTLNGKTYLLPQHAQSPNADESNNDYNEDLEKDYENEYDEDFDEDYENEYDEDFDENDEDYEELLPYIFPDEEWIETQNIQLSNQKIKAIICIILAPISAFYLQIQSGKLFNILNENFIYIILLTIGIFQILMFLAIILSINTLAKKSY